MGNKNRRRQVDSDDSLLASVAGVPLTRMARVGLCFVWAGFWAARVLLSDALALLNALQVKPALLELLGQNAFDQGFSICMAWLTVEVAVIVRDTVGKGGTNADCENSDKLDRSDTQRFAFGTT